MPADVAGHLLGLLEEFLDAALAEYALAGAVGLAQGLDGMEFGHGHQSDSFGEPGVEAAYCIGYVAHQSTTFMR